MSEEKDKHDGGTVQAYPHTLCNERVAEKDKRIAELESALDEYAETNEAYEQAALEIGTLREKLSSVERELQEAQNKLAGAEHAVQDAVKTCEKVERERDELKAKFAKYMPVDDEYRLDQNDLHRIINECESGNDLSWCVKDLLLAHYELSDYKATKGKLTKAVEALRALLASPYGCRFCDSGALRESAMRRGVGHDEDCGYVLARQVLLTLQGETK